MLRRAIEVSEPEEEEEGAGTEESLEETTTLVGIVTDSVDSTPTLLGLGSFLSCLGVDDTSSETETVEVTVTAGTVESAEVAEADLDVLTI
jgi:hypothetical protein